MICRPGCAACCIYISISSPLPGMPQGKPAGVRCINLDQHDCCTVYETPAYPRVCRNFQAQTEMCGATQEHAMHYLIDLEEKTQTV